MYKSNKYDGTELLGLMDFIHRPVFNRRKQNNTMFRRLNLSPSSGVWDKIKPTHLGSLEGASLNHLRTETDAVSET
jgi:hypothetical protein